MGFLDNLESNLKSMEARDEALDQRNQQNRQDTRTQRLAEAPWAEKLKKSAFTEELLRQATRIGFAQRTKVRITWLGTTLRLEAGERKLELRPTAQGIVAVSQVGRTELGQAAIDVDKDSAATVAHQWLTGPAAV